jgi:cytochrome c biogenesis factor
MSMARRSFHDEPMSKIAAWSSRLALFAIVVAALSVIIVRSGLLELVPALATFAAALVFAGLSICSLSRLSW